MPPGNYPGSIGGNVGVVLEPWALSACQTVFGRNMEGAATFQSQTVHDRVYGYCRAASGSATETTHWLCSTGTGVQTFGPSDGVRVGAISPRSMDEDRKSGLAGNLVCSSSITDDFMSINAVDKESLRGISGIVETANGDLWLNGLGGIFHVRRAEITEALKNPAYRVSGERFGRREGLPGLPPQFRPIPTAIEGTDGRLWFTVNNGVVWLDPARASNKIPPPPVTIQSVSADDRGYRLDSPIRFPAHTSSVQISYAAVSLSDPEAIRFRYKLQETDQDWHEVSDVQLRELSQSTSRFVPLRRQCQRHEWVMVRQYCDGGIHCLTCFLPDELVPRPLRGRFSGAAVGGLPVPDPATAAGIQHGKRSAPE